MLVHPSPHLWTIGHSNHTFERFVELLRSEEIEFVVDVRSYPYSRFAEQFNREKLEVALPAANIRYLFLGEELGGRPSREDHYDAEGRALYDRMAEEPSFRAAIERLIGGSREHRLALMCSEGEPHECHRRLLVGKVLAEHGVQLHHILPNGAVDVEDAVQLRPRGQAGESVRRGDSGVEIYTIGFTQTSAEHFFGRLKTADVQRLLDVRLNNSSQLAGFAKARDLPYFLRELVGASYEHDPRLAPTQDLLDAYKKRKGDWAAYEHDFMGLMAQRRDRERPLARRVRDPNRAALQRGDRREVSSQACMRIPRSTLAGGATDTPVSEES